MMGADALQIQRAASEHVHRVRVRHLRGLGWLLPLWALTCGVLASNHFDLQESTAWLRLAALALLVVGGWGRLWIALSRTDWATPLGAWRAWRAQHRLASLPYTRPGTAADRSARWIGQLRTWLQATLWPCCGSALISALAAFLSSAVLALLIGPEIVLLSIACLAVMQLALAWERGRGQAGAGWQACVAVLLPWLAGHVAFGTLTVASGCAACGVSLAIAGLGAFESGIGRAAAATASVLLAVLLIFAHHPLAAAGVLALHTILALLVPWRGEPVSPAWQWEFGLPFVVAAGFVVAWAL